MFLEIAPGIYQIARTNRRVLSAIDTKATKTLTAWRNSFGVCALGMVCITAIQLGISLALGWPFVWQLLVILFVFTITWMLLSIKLEIAGNINWDIEQGNYRDTFIRTNHDASALALLPMLRTETIVTAAEDIGNFFISSDIRAYDAAIPWDVYKTVATSYGCDIFYKTRLALIDETESFVTNVLMLGEGDVKVAEHLKKLRDDALNELRLDANNNLNNAKVRVDQFTTLLNEYKEE